MAGTRASMDLLTKEKAPQEMKFNVIGLRDEADRLKLAVKKTNQYGAYQNIKSHAFELTHPKKDVVCRFPITMVKYKGRIPKIGTVDAHDVPEETYMFFEDQAQWNKKYLTHAYSEKEKQRGYIVASDPQTYSVSTYYECLPNSVLKSTRYKDMYLQKYANNYSDLTEEGISEEFYVLLCNA